MTPTLWAAFEGNLEALRLLVGRGYNCIQPQSDYEREHDPHHHNDQFCPSLTIRTLYEKGITIMSRKTRQGSNYLFFRAQVSFISVYMESILWTYIASLGSFF